MWTIILIIFISVVFAVSAIFVLGEGEMTLTIMSVITSLLLMFLGGFIAGFGNTARVDTGKAYQVHYLMDNSGNERSALMLATAADKQSPNFFSISKECAANAKAGAGRMYTRLIVGDERDKCTWEKEVDACVHPECPKCPALAPGEVKIITPEGLISR